jgi:endonuclease/exonuclease/phosphatase family metal-dependent hydrolase
MSYGLFEDLKTGRVFWVAVTHLDHLGVEARIEQAGILSRWMFERPEPRILMGDFNSPPDSEVHRSLVSSGPQFSDTWQMLEMSEGEQSMTHHDFRGNPQNFRMDWILVSRDFNVQDAWIIRDHQDGRYPSDHFPYAARVEWL